MIESNFRPILKTSSAILKTRGCFRISPSPGSGIRTKCLGLKQGSPQYAMIKKRKYLLGLVVYLSVYIQTSYAGCEGACFPDPPEVC